MGPLLLDVRLQGIWGYNYQWEGNLPQKAYIPNRLDFLTQAHLYYLF